MKVKFTPTARRQFLDAIAYIRRDKPSVAVSFRQVAKEKLKRLERFPESGRRIPEFSDLPYREVIISPYRFFYRIEINVVWIVAAWHSAQLSHDPDSSND